MGWAAVGGIGSIGSSSGFNGGGSDSGGAIYFAGGKVTISGYEFAYMTDVVDIFVPGQGFAPAPIKLSVGRESTNTVALSPNTLAVAGGWNKKGGESVIDVFLSLNEQGASTGESGSRSGSQMETKTQKQHEGKRSGGSHTPGVGSGVGSVDGGVGASRLPDKTLHMGSAGYDVGAASIEVTATATTQASSSSSTTTLTYIVDNEQLLVVDGTGNLLATIPLPEALSGK